jgi:dolichol-phosphate mannosyltransferase
MISIILPAYNEEATIAEVIDAIHARLRLDGEDFEIVAVDDGSRDATPGLLDAIAARDPVVRVVHHARNQGLGRALRTGFQAAQGRLVVTMDADMTHPPEMIGELVRACDCDFVVASRFVPGGGMQGVPWWRVIISQIGNLVFRLLFRTTLRDITAGYKIYRTALLRDLPIDSAGFEVQLEITIRLLKSGATVKEIPYVLGSRTAGESKLNYPRVIAKYFRLMGVLLRLPRTERVAETVNSVR